jgi:hypothetical protein
VTGNTITNHKTTGVLVTSAFGASISYNPATKDDQGRPYDPFERGIYVHDNAISNFGASPGGAFADASQLGPFTTGFFASLAGIPQPQNFPAVMWDGVVDPATGSGFGTYTYVNASSVYNGLKSGGTYSGNLQVCSKNNAITPPAGAAISYENIDLDLVALPSTGSANFPSPARMDCTISLPAVSTTL